jgi:hypothetical protein
MYRSGVGNQPMHVLWGPLTVALGLFMLVPGSSRSGLIVYRLMAARSGILWGGKAHRFYQSESSGLEE